MYLVLAFGANGIRSPKDHDAFLGIGKVVRTLAYHTPFLGYCLLALSFLWPAGLSQKALEEFVVLVEVLDGICMVGAWAIHELVEVVR